jgi:hypothetical protein
VQRQLAVPGLATLAHSANVDKRLRGQRGQVTRHCSRDWRCIGFVRKRRICGLPWPLMIITCANAACSVSGQRSACTRTTACISCSVDMYLNVSISELHCGDKVWKKFLGVRGTGPHGARKHCSYVPVCVYPLIVLSSSRLQERAYNAKHDCSIPAAITMNIPATVVVALGRCVTTDTHAHIAKTRIVINNAISSVHTCWHHCPCWSHYARLNPSVLPGFTSRWGSAGYN